METQLIHLIVEVLIFAVIIYGLVYTCRSFGVPQPIQWIVAAVVIIILLVFLLHQSGAVAR